MRLLLAEDDRMIGESLEEALRKEHYAVDWAHDGTAATLALETHNYDLILLDIGLPKKTGLQVLTDYRKQGGNNPVLLITARDGVSDRVQGLDGGADDYLVKPFDLNELLARLRALLRRNTGQISLESSHAGLVLNPATHTAIFNQQSLDLSAKEFAVLHTLIMNPSKLVSRDTLEQSLYGWNEEIESNTVEVYIHQLRKKLGAEFIINVRGVGYKLKADV